MSNGERRGTERLLLEIPIRVMAFASSCGGFSEDTRTVEVNRAGARIALKHRVAPEDTIRIVNLENLAEADFRVVGRTRAETAGGAEWGVECLDQGRDIWGVEFPKPSELGESKAGALLECVSCHRQVLFVLGLMEVSLLETKGDLQRICERCGEFSNWVYADLERRPKTTPTPEVVPPPPPEHKWDGKVERRIHKRLPLKLPVLIGNCKGETEISKTENLSKGGLAVVLGLMLEVGEMVTVVCPYSAQGQNLEQKGEIRRRTSFYQGSRWLYGVRYVR